MKRTKLCPFQLKGKCSVGRAHSMFTGRKINTNRRHATTTISMQGNDIWCIPVGVVSSQRSRLDPPTTRPNLTYSGIHFPHFESFSKNNLLLANATCVFQGRANMYFSPPTHTQNDMNLCFTGENQSTANIIIVQYCNVCVHHTLKLKGPFIAISCGLRADHMSSN